MLRLCLCFYFCFFLLSAYANPVIDGYSDSYDWELATEVRVDKVISPKSYPLPVETLARYIVTGSDIIVLFYSTSPLHNLPTFFRKRDEGVSDNFVGVRIRNSRSSPLSYEFLVTSGNSKIDSVYNSRSKNRNYTWDGEWESRVKLREGHFYVEIKIPKKNFLFSSSGSGADKGWYVEFLRNHVSDKRVLISNSSYDENDVCDFCHYVKLEDYSSESSGTEKDDLFSILPYAVYSNSKASSEDGASSRSEVLDYGVDAEFKLGSSTELSATINPDFSSIEADAGVIEVNQENSLFYEERRSFFSNSSGYFETFQDDMVYTRNLVSPSFGIKATRSFTSGSAAFFYVEDQFLNIIVPGPRGSYTKSYGLENSAIATRVTYSLTKDSDIGGLYTSRESNDYKNEVFFVDYKMEIGGHSRVDAYAAISRSQIPSWLMDNEIKTGDSTLLDESMSGDAIYLRYTYSDDLWDGFFYKKIVSNKFRADLGYYPEIGMDKTSFNLTRKFDILDAGDIYLGATRTKKEDANGLHVSSSDSIKLSAFELGFTSWDFYLWRKDRSDLKGDVVSVSGVGILVEEQLSSSTSIWTLSEFGGKIDYANNLKGDGVYVSLGVDWSINKNNELGLAFYYENMHSSLGYLYKTKLVDLRYTYTWNENLSFRFSAVLSETEDFYESMFKDVEIFVSSLFSYNLGKSLSFYAGFSTQQYRSVSFDATEDFGSIFSKLTYRFSF